MLQSERLKKIQEAQEQVEFWTTRLTALRNEQRRACTVILLEEDPAKAWYGLPESEKCDKDSVIAAIKGDPLFFGRCPAFTSKLPEHLHKDPDVLVAFLESYDYENDYPYYLENVEQREFFCIPIPEELLDNKEFVLRVCTKEGQHFEQLSGPLFENAEVALVAFTNASYQAELFDRFPNQLKGDMDFLLQCVEATVCDYVWVESVAPNLSLEDQRALILSIARRYSDSCIVPFDSISGLIRDDEEIMKKFVERDGYELRYCSKRLRANEALVRTAVKTSPSSIEYAIGKVREELVADRDFMSRAFSMSPRPGSLLACASDALKEDRNTVLMAVKSWLAYSDLPEQYKDDAEIMLNVIRHRREISFDQLCKPLRSSKDFIIAALHERKSFYKGLPDELQQDKEIAMEVLAHGEFLSCEMDVEKLVFEKNPLFHESREALLLLVHKQLRGVSASGQAAFCGILQKSPFLEDKTFLLLALKKFPGAHAHLPYFLRWDVEVVSAALDGCEKSRFSSYCPILGATTGFMADNVGLVGRAIDVASDKNADKLFKTIPKDLFRFRSLMRPALRKGWDVLGTRRHEGLSRGSQSLVQIAVEHNWRAFRHANFALRSDRDFVLSLAQIDGRVIKFAASNLKYDYEILTTAIRNNNSVVAHCFDYLDDHDFNFLLSFAGTIQGKLNHFESYLLSFLRGVQENSSSCNNGCGQEGCLPTLDLGHETTVALKRTIAEFAGVPLGAELLMLRTVSARLAKSGF